MTPPIGNTLAITCGAARRRVPLLPELHAGRQAAGHHGATASHPDLEFRGDAGNAPPACGGARRRGGHLLALLHHDSSSRPGDRQFVATWENGAAAASSGRAFDVSGEAAYAAAASAPANLMRQRGCGSLFFPQRFDHGAAEHWPCTDYPPAPPLLRAPKTLH